MELKGITQSNLEGCTVPKLLNHDKAKHKKSHLDKIIL